MTGMILRSDGELGWVPGRVRPDLMWQGSGNHDTGWIDVSKYRMLRIALIAAGNEIQLMTESGWGMHGVRYNENNTTAGANMSWNANVWGTPLYSSFGSGDHILCEIEACTWDGSTWIGYMRGSVSQYAGFGCTFWANGSRWKFRHNGGNPYGIRIERFTAT